MAPPCMHMAVSGATSPVLVITPSGMQKAHRERHCEGIASS